MRGCASIRTLIRCEMMKAVFEKDVGVPAVKLCL